MIITYWILLIFFGIFALNGTFKFYFGDGMSTTQGILWFISVIITAITAGLLF